MFCPGCGKEIAENTAFCPGCGKAIGSGAPNAQPVSVGAGALHCPNCKSRNITISTESSVSAGLTTHQGGFTTTQMANTHRNFWFCSDCGTKFRNIQSLEEEIRSFAKTPWVCGVISVIALAVFVYFIALSADSIFGFLGVGFASIFGITGLSFLIAVFVSIAKLKKMKRELEYLKANCFN